MIDKLEKKYTDAFHNFFGKAVHPEYTTCTRSRDSYVITNQTPIGCESITGIFFRQNEAIKVVETHYDTSCRFQLRHISDGDLGYLFRDNNYNYDVAKKLVYDLFEIGKKFKFFTEMTPIKDLEIKDNYNKETLYRYESIQTVTKITLSSIVAGKNQQGKATKKTAIFHLGFYLSEENELHPILLLTIPYSGTKFVRFSVNLHSSKRDELVSSIPAMLTEFEGLLMEQLEFVLNRTLKIKKDEIKKLTFEEKKNYLPVVEMVKC